MYRTANWEKTAGLHAQMQPTGLVFQANEPAGLCGVPLKINNYSSTQPRKYDRNGNLILDHQNDTNPTTGSSISPVEHGYVSKLQSLSTVMESQLIEQEEETLSEARDGTSAQTNQSSKKEGFRGSRFSSSRKSMSNGTPLSTKRRNVREMYNYYGIQRPAELSSEYGTLEYAQPIRVQRNCHVCDWINGPDTKCWKCLHRFCDECDEISPQAFFKLQAGKSIPLEDFETNIINPIKSSSTGFHHQMQDSVGEELTNREDASLHKYPKINVPRPTSISALKDHIESSPKPDAVMSQSPRKSELRKVTMPSTKSLRSEYIRNGSKLNQSQGSTTQIPGIALPARTRESESSSYHPLPVYIYDIPRGSPVVEKALEKCSIVPGRLQVKTAAPSTTKSKQTSLDSQQRPSPSQDILTPQVKQTKLHKERRDAPPTELSRNLKSDARTDLVLENQPFRKSGALTDSQSLRLTPVAARIGRYRPHRRRRTRRQKSGSESNASSWGDQFSCESPGCRATHTGHQPYRHSISCTRKKHRFADDTGSGYSASRSQNEDPRRPLLQTQIKSSLDVVYVGGGEHSLLTIDRQNWHGRLNAPQELVVKEQPGECLQCYGYLNGCPCGTCQSVNRVIMGKEECPLSPANESPCDTKVLIPTPQTKVPSPSSTTRKIVYEKMKGDMLGKPISLGYEPVPKITLHTIAYPDEEASKLPSVSETFKMEPERQPPLVYPGSSDLPTPATEKARQESFFADIHQQLVAGSIQQEQSPDLHANTKRNRDSDDSDSLLSVSGLRTALSQIEYLSKRGIGWQESENSFSESGSYRKETSVRGFKPPKIAKQPLLVPSEDNTEVNKHEKSSETKAGVKMLRETEASSLDKSPPTPASRSLSAILERDTLQLLNQRLQQQQYELKRITRLFCDHFAGVSQPSPIPNAASIVAKRESEKDSEKKETEKEETKKRAIPWRLNFFDRKSPPEYDEPVSPQRTHLLEECRVDDPVVQGGKNVTPEPDIPAAEMDTPAPKIVVREPTLISMDATPPVAARKSSLIRDSNVNRRVFSPLGFSFSSSNEKDTQQVERGVKENGNDEECLQTEGNSARWIRGITIVIHLEGKEDLVYRADLNEGVH